MDGLIATIGGLGVLLLGLFLILLAILWLVLPFAVFGINNRLDKIISIQRATLQVIALNTSQYRETLDGVTPAARAPVLEEFLEACKKGPEDKVKDLLKAGVNVNARDKDGVTPLMIAIKSGNFGVVKLLLNNGADPNMVNRDGKTALQLIPAGETRIVELINDVVEKAEYEERERLVIGNKFKGKRRIHLIVIGLSALLVGLVIIVLSAFRGH